MALVFGDRVYETSTTTGNGTLTLAGIGAANYRTFSDVIGNGNTCYYSIVHRNANEWEVGVGTVSAGALARTTVLKTSAGDTTKIVFSAGTKDVFCDLPAERLIALDAAGTGTTSLAGVAITAGAASFTTLAASGNLTVGASTFVVTAATGAVSTSGSLAITGALTGVTTAALSGALTIGDTLNLKTAGAAGYLSWDGSDNTVFRAATGKTLSMGGNNAGQLLLSDGLVTVVSGADFKLGAAASASVATASTHKIAIKDNTGTTYYALVTT